ncbi:MAG: hypothetical protein V3R94_07760 [Acidobacteriota bacterium]
MRLWLVWLGLGVLSVTLLGLLPPTRAAIFEQVVPEDILALVVVTNPPSSLDFLDQVQLSQWLDLDSRTVIESVPESLQDPLWSLLVEEVKSVWVLIHQLARKENESWRIHFTALLIPGSPDRPQALEVPIERAVRNLFGEEHLETSEHQNILIYSGKDPGQVLYQVRMPDYLLVSNSSEGLQKTLRTVAGKEKSLSTDRSYQSVKNQLAVDGGLFVFFRANRLLPLLPEFGYLVRWQEGRISEQYYQVSDP